MKISIQFEESAKWQAILSHENAASVFANNPGNLYLCYEQLGKQLDEPGRFEDWLTNQAMAASEMMWDGFLNSDKNLCLLPYLSDEVDSVFENDMEWMTKKTP